MAICSASDRCPGEFDLTPVALPQDGGCACGAVRYQLKGKPLLVYACHCHDCQSRSGAAFTLNMVVLSADVSTSGHFEVREHIARGDRRVRQTWCPACGIAVSAQAPSAPDYATLLAGTLDDAGWVMPIVQTFVESAIPWALIAGVRAAPWSEFDYVELGREWAASAPKFISRS